MIASIFRDALRFFLQHWIALVLTALLTVGVTEALFGTNGTLVPMPADRGLYPYSLLQLIVLMTGTIVLHSITTQFAVKDAQAKDIKLLDIAFRLLMRLPILLTVGLLSFGIVVVGLMLLVVPGVVVMVWLFAVIPVAAIEENYGILASLRRSRDLVKGHFWLVLGVVMITVLPLSAISYYARAMSLSDTYRYEWIDWGIVVLSRLYASIVGAQTYLKLASVREENIAQG